MADIQLRLGKDVLVLSTSISHQLEKQGTDAERDTAFTLLVEPEVMEDIYNLESMCGVQCVVAPTAQMTPARLSHTGMRHQAEVLAKQAMAIVEAGNYQHIFVEIGPCGLPLDVSSKASLIENRDQYASAARLFGECKIDAFFLNGFSRVADLKCALMGIAKVSDIPVIASVDVNADGTLSSFGARGVSVGESIEDAASVAAEFGAAVFGFCTDAAPDDAVALSHRVSKVVDLPKLAQLFVRESDGIYSAPYADADDIVDAGEALRESGVQFLRACGFAPASYAGALVAATEASDVVIPDNVASREFDPEQDIDALVAKLKKRVDESLKN